mgnify:CR=1 FL=1
MSLKFSGHLPKYSQTNFISIRRFSLRKEKDLTEKIRRRGIRIDTLRGLLDLKERPTVSILRTIIMQQYLDLVIRLMSS